MAFDDDDVPTAPPPAALAAQASDDTPTAEETMEEETQDFRLFASLSNKKNISSKSIRKGEKDFESHGTKAQASAIEQSRQAMEDVLSYTRVHRPDNWLRGWYFPDHWANAPVEEAEEAPTSGSGPHSSSPGEKRWPLSARDRVVIVDGDKGYFKTLGRIITGQSKDQPGWGKIWLLPEEALFLVERGSLDLWWPMKSLADVFPAPGAEKDESDHEKPLQDEPVDEYDLGLPLSLQAAYSLLIGQEGERGKVTLQKYQTYSSLCRAGYRILRAPSARPPDSSEPAPQSSVSLWQWLFSLVSSERELDHPPYGPLVRPGLYRSYKSIYRKLAVVPRHVPSQQPSCPWQPREPYEVSYYLWKTFRTESGSWSKTKPPPPDFFLAVVDAQESSVPTLEEIAALIDSTPWDSPKPQWIGPGKAKLYPRLKHGYRSVLVAVVDHGVINYIRFGEGAFGEETLWHDFDSTKAVRAGKGGGRGGGRGGTGSRGSRGRSRHRR